METYKDSVAFHSELKILLIQLVDVFKSDESPNLPKLEQLLRLIIRQKVDYLDAILELFNLSKDEEFIQVILISFVLKILREYMPYIESEKEKFIEVLDRTIEIVRPVYSDAYYTSKMLEFVRCYFALPMEYITLPKIIRLWEVLRTYFKIDEDSMAQSNHDAAMKCIKGFFTKFKERNCPILADNEREIIGFFFGELNKEIVSMLAQIKSPENKTIQRKVLLKSLENFCSSMLLAFEYLIRYNLNFMSSLVYNDISYMIIQLVDVDESSLTTLSLSFHSLMWKLTNSKTCNISSLLSTLFSQVIMKPLQKFTNKYSSNSIKEKDIINLHHLISHIISFLENKKNVAFLFLNNDLTPLRKNVYEQILQNIFTVKIGKNAGETLTQPYSKEIFAIIIDFLNGSLEVDDHTSIHINLCYNSNFKDNVSETDKQNFTKLLLDSAKWEKYGNLHNTSFKEFLNQIVSEYYIDESLEEKATKIAYQLQLSHHIDSNKVIEIVGQQKTLNSEILKKYIACINFGGKDIIQAFRLFFINFFMAGEAQVIERVIEEFCTQLFQTLPADTFFKDKGVLHTFCYAIIMLHTDLHKPTVIDKMTTEGFIKNVKGINNGENLPEAFLKEIYNNIKSNEMKTLSTRDLSNEENISHETWLNYLKMVEMYDANRDKIYSSRDKIIKPEDIKDLSTLIDHQCYKNLILKIIDNIELFIAKSSLEPQPIDQLIERVVKACIHFEMSDNIDTLMTTVANMTEVSVDFDFAKKNDVILWNLFCAFLVAKKTLVYLNNSLPTVIKLLVGTLNFRKYAIEDRVIMKYTNIHTKIKDSYKFLSKATNQSSFFGAVLTFLATKDDSSDDEQNESYIQKEKVKILYDRLQKATSPKILIYKKFFLDANIFEEIFDQTKFLTEAQLNKIFDTLTKDSDILDGISKNPNVLLSICCLCSEIGFRNYDRPSIFWNLVSSLFVNITIHANTQRTGIDANMQKSVASQIASRYEKLNEGLKLVIEKKPKRLACIQSFSHYLLLELCLKFSHKSTELDGFESIFNYALEFINESSISILIGLLQMIQETINSHRSESDENLKNWIYIVRTLKKITDSLDKKNLDIPEVVEASIKSSDVINDMLLKFSFLGDFDFLESYKEVVSLLSQFDKSKISMKFKLNTKFSTHLYMLLNLLGDASKKRSPEYIKECFATIPIYSDLTYNIFLNSNQDDILTNFKLLQKVILLLEPKSHDFERIFEVYKRLIGLDKRILSFSDENLAIGYIELIGKFMLTHIESCDKKAQNEFLWQYYHKFFELFMSSQVKKYKTFLETLVESLASTTNILVNIGIIDLSPEGTKKDELNKKIFGVLEKFPGDKFKYLKQDGVQQPKDSSPNKIAEGSSPVKVESPKKEEEKQVGSVESLEKKDSKSEEIPADQKENKENSIPNNIVNECNGSS